MNTGFLVHYLIYRDQLIRHPPTLLLSGPLCRVNPLTDRGKRLQLVKILCLTIIPILGVWGFTMYSLSDSVKSKSDIEVVSPETQDMQEPRHEKTFSGLYSNRRWLEP